VIGEAGRFLNSVARTSSEARKGAISALTTAFERLEERGKLRFDDSSLATARFNWLVLAIPLNHAMVSGDDRPPGEAELQRYADSAVRVFLAAHLAT
jgi:TetR/AcrR family transcriptional repressor of mexJK operon